MNKAKTEPRQMDAPKSAEIHFDLQQSIAEAAYYKAEKRGFIPGFEEQDWAEAETEILSLYINDDTESKLHYKSEVVSLKHRDRLLVNKAPMQDDSASQSAP